MKCPIQAAMLRLHPLWNERNCQSRGDMNPEGEAGQHTLALDKLHEGVAGIVDFVELP